MNTLSGEKAPGQPVSKKIALCPRCKREVLPRRAQPSWRRDVLRKASTGMVRESDPKAEKIRQRKAQKGEKRYMTRNTLGIVKLILKARHAVPQQPIDDNCPHCLELQRKLNEAQAA